MVRNNSFFELLKTITLIVISVLIINHFIAIAYSVKGESMEPTLHNGDILIVNLFRYDIYDIKRFDVIVFHANDKDDYVKRVIALPGDHIYYKNDILYINDEPLPEPYLSELKYKLMDYKLTDDFKLEELTGEYFVPDNHVFVMGDNRRKSLDSRIIGFIDVDTIVGKVEFRYWPINNFGYIK